MGRVKDYYWDIISSPEWLERNLRYSNGEETMAARTTSYLKRHRPICAVLQEIGNIATNDGRQDIMTLVEEAISYAKRMDAKLVEIRNKENEKEE